MKGAHLDGCEWSHFLSSTKHPPEPLGHAIYNYMCLNDWLPEVKATLRVRVVTCDSKQR
jgi:hypothetical protein